LSKASCQPKWGWLLTDGIQELEQVAKMTKMTAHCGRYNPAYERYFVPVSESAPQ